MELQGHWEPGVMQGLTDGQAGLGDKLGWFPFPTVDGGAGRPGRRPRRRRRLLLLGRRAAGVRRTSSKYLLTDEVQTSFGATDIGLPADPGRRGLGHRPDLAERAARSATTRPYIQLYFDKAFADRRRAAP